MGAVKLGENTRLTVSECNPIHFEAWQETSEEGNFECYYGMRRTSTFPDEGRKPTARWFGPMLTTSGQLGSR